MARKRRDDRSLCISPFPFRALKISVRYFLAQFISIFIYPNKNSIELNTLNETETKRSTLCTVTVAITVNVITVQECRFRQASY